MEIDFNMLKTGVKDKVGVYVGCMAGAMDSKGNQRLSIDCSLVFGEIELQMVI